MMDSMATAELVSVEEYPLSRRGSLHHHWRTRRGNLYSTPLPLHRSPLSQGPNVEGSGQDRRLSSNGRTVCLVDRSSQADATSYTASEALPVDDGILRTQNPDLNVALSDLF